MRYVPSIPPVTTAAEPPQVKGVTRIRGVKPVYPGEQVGLYAGQQAHPQVAPQQAQPQPVLPFVERRLAQRRINNRPVVVELRSGLDRRQHHQIDETA